MNNKLSESAGENVQSSINELSTRLTGLAAKHGGKNSFADLIGISYSQLHRMCSGDADMKLSLALKIAEVTGVSVQWLATGDGSPFQADSAPDSDDYALIPGYNVQVSAGNGSLIDGEPVTRRLAFRRNWLNFRGLHEKDLVVVFAKGDSMEPTISDGNTIMVDRSNATPRDGGMYVIRVDDNLLVKRTQIVPGQGIQLISDNKDYPLMLVKPGDQASLEFIGRVVWIGKDV